MKRNFTSRYCLGWKAADPAEDIRDCKAVDRDNEEVGELRLGLLLTPCVLGLVPPPGAPSARPLENAPRAPSC